MTANEERQFLVPTKPRYLQVLSSGHSVTALRRLMIPMVLVKVDR